jgi:lipocalin
VTDSIGKATIPNANNPCDLEVTFGFPYIPAPYDVIVYDTANYQWAAVASCFGLEEIIGDNVWIISREQNLDTATYNSIVDYLTSSGFNVTDLVRQFQGSSCTY